MIERKPTLIFFIGLTLLYLSFSPGAILGMGYTAENVNASNQLISNLGDWLAFRRAAIIVTWPRHGLFELLFDIPFLLISRLFFGNSPVWTDRVLSIQPVVMTSLICTLIFIWVRRITSSLKWSYVLAITAAFSTMLWAYAYIGLETTQSLFVLLSGYLALGSDRKKTWLKTVLFAVCCGFAVSLKSNGILLAPAVSFLAFAYLRDAQAEVPRAKTVGWKKAVVVVTIVLSMYLLNAYTRSLSPVWASGTMNVFRQLNVDSSLTIAFNIVSLLVSLNKGLLIYCPVVLVCLLGIRGASRRGPQVAIFAGLTLAGLAGCSLFYFYTDETWGPRYLHSAVAPLIVCFSLTRESVRFQVRREVILLTLAICGAAVSFLGAFYYYGTLQRAATQAGQATIETFQTDPNWNHIRFNLMLLKVWERGGTDPVLWTPTRHWWFEQPEDAAPLKSVNLRDYALPQSSLVRGWPLEKTGSYAVIWWSYLFCMIAGALLLVWFGFVVSRARPQARSEAPSGGPI